MGIFSLRILNLTLLIFSYCSSTRSQFIGRKLPNATGINDPTAQYFIRLVKNYAFMACNKRDTQKLTELNVMSIRLSCCLTLNTTFGDIFKKFNIKNVKYLVVNSNNYNKLFHMSKHMFQSTRSLESLSFDSIPLSLNIDFLENCPDLIELYLVKSKLTKIDRYFKYVPKLCLLTLARNQIEILPDEVFKDLGNLTRLDLSSNKLASLTKNMFTGLTNRLMLTLDYNRIEHLAEDTFSHMHKLVGISLQNNNINKIYSQMFITNSLLEHVLLNDNPSIELSDYVFANLTLLQSVDLSYDNIADIPENIFRNCENLLYITLKGNSLTSIPEKIFTGLNHLQRLDLSNNKLAFASISTQVLFPLENLIRLDLSNNRLKSIGPNLFRELFTLRTLNLNNNNISFIDLLGFTDLQGTLTHLDLSFNQLNNTASLFAIIEFLEELNLSHNNLEDPEIRYMDNLKKLDLSYNTIRSLEVFNFLQFRHQYTIEINLTGNQITHLNFSKGSSPNVIAKKKETFDGASDFVIILDNNPVICDCSNYDLIRYNHDKFEVMKSFIEIKQDKLFCSNYNTMLVKDLKPYHINCPVRNGCPLPCTCFYKPYNRTVIVDCSFNNLTTYPEFYINETDHQQTMLNLSGNFLEKGPVQGLNYDNVTYLDMSRNRIYNITWIPPHIKEIDLYQNNLKRLSSHFINMLKNRTSLERLSLKDNLWECDCDALNLRKYLIEYHGKVNLSDVYCYKGHTLLVKITDLCQTSAYLTVLLPIVLLFLLCFAVALALYYRYETEIKIYLYARNLCLWFVTEDELDKDKTYDVFISFAHQDEKFVVEQLLPELEHGETPCKVCFHVRDWIPGELITTQVINSIKESRRTLVVLSNNFVDSVWGKLEFRVAHTEAVSEGRARVIVVIYGDLNEGRLDDELKMYLKTNTYIKWGDKYFWNKVKYALLHSKSKLNKKNNKQDNIMLEMGEHPLGPANTTAQL